MPSDAHRPGKCAFVYTDDFVSYHLSDSHPLQQQRLLMTQRLQDRVRYGFGGLDNPRCWLGLVQKVVALKKPVIALGVGYNVRAVARLWTLGNRPEPPGPKGTPPGHTPHEASWPGGGSFFRYTDRDGSPPPPSSGMSSPSAS